LQNLAAAYFQKEDTAMVCTCLKQSLKISEISATGTDGKSGQPGNSFNPWIGFREFLAGWLVSGLLALLLIFPALASATPPSAIEPVYLDKEQMLQVTITHNSFSPGFHYIKKVEIQKNSEQPVLYEYSNQPDKSTFTYKYTFKVLPKKGDRVDIKVSCSIYGSRTVKIVIGEVAGE